MSTVSPTSSSSTSAADRRTSASALITSTGIGSGLDISAIVSSLTTAFGAAQTDQLTNQANTLDAQVSAYGTFTSALDTLQAARDPGDAEQLAGFDATVARHDHRIGDHHLGGGRPVHPGRCRISRPRRR